jgi:hypothetical protein
VNYRKRPSGRYQVVWRFDDDTQGAKTVDTEAEARDLAAEQRLEMRHGTWAGRQRGKLPLAHWDTEWWAVWSTDPRISPTTLAGTESRRRLRLLPTSATSRSRRSPPRCCATGSSSSAAPSAARR